MAVIVVFLQTTVIWQIALMTLTVIVQVIILGRVEPFKGKEKNQLEMINETFVMFVMYHMICFTAFVPDLVVRDRLGYVLLTLIVVHLTASLFIITRDTYRKARTAHRIY